jgi:hypothetical protein
VGDHLITPFQCDPCWFCNLLLLSCHYFHCKVMNLCQWNGFQVLSAPRGSRLGTSILLS